MPTETLRPNAAGASTDLTANGAAANWDCVDEAVADDTTTYVSNNLLGFVYDSYNITNTALTTETVDSVDVWDRSKVNAGAGLDDEKVAGVRLSGSNTMGASVQLTTTYTDRESAALARPGGGSWAVADLDALQARLGLQEFGSSYAACTQVFVEINYTAVSGGDGTDMPWPDFAALSPVLTPTPMIAI